MSRPKQKIAGDGRHFVADGGQRIRQAVEPEIRERIREKYSPLIREANWLKRLILRWRMEREIRAELRKIAPDGAMYLHASRDNRANHSP